MYAISIILAVIQLGFISLILFKEIQIKSSGAFLWATLIVMFGLPHLVTAIFENMQYDVIVYCEASLFVIAFCFLYYLIRNKTRVIFLKSANETNLQTNLKYVNSLYVYIVFGILIVGFIYYFAFIIKNQGGLLNTSWGSSRDIETDYVSISGLVSRLLLVYSGLSLYFFDNKKYYKTILVLVMYLALVLLTRNRVHILPFFIFFVALFIQALKDIKAKHLLLALFGGCLIIYIVYAIRAFRYLGSLSNAINNFSWQYINSTVLSFINDQNGELGLRQYFYYFIDNDNHFDGFNKAHTYIRMLLVYIPSQFSFGLKPESFDLTMGRAIGMIQGGSMHPTLFGDCFGNLYWFGILLGLFWGLFANIIDKLILNQKEYFNSYMIYCLSAYAFVVIGRGSVYNGFEKLAWGILILFVLSYILRKTKNMFIRIK